MRRITTDYEKNRMADTICKLAFAMAAITTHKWFLKSTGLVHGLKLIEKIQTIIAPIPRVLDCIDVDNAVSAPNGSVAHRVPSLSATASLGRSSADCSDRELI